MTRSTGKLVPLEWSHCSKSGRSTLLHDISFNFGASEGLLYVIVYLSVGRGPCATWLKKRCGLKRFNNHERWTIYGYMFN